MVKIKSNDEWNLERKREKEIRKEIDDSEKYREGKLKWRIQEDSEIEQELVKYKFINNEELW